MGGGLKQSFETLEFGGSIAFLGYLSIIGTGPSMSGLEVCIGTLTKNASVRGILIGSVEQVNAMNVAIETHKIKPIIDTVFKFEDVKNAYEYQWSRKCVEKVVIKVPK